MVESISACIVFSSFLFFCSLGLCMSMVVVLAVLWIGVTERLFVTVVAGDALWL